MVAEAVTDYRRDLDGDTDAPQVDTTVDLPVDAYLPHDYVPAERLRLEAYRRLASAHDDTELDAVAEDLRDRFGAGPDGRLPDPVQALFAVARLRVFLRAYGLTDVSVQGKFLRLAPVVLPESAQLRLGRLHPKSVVKPSLSTVLVPLPTAPQAGRLSGGPVTGTDLIDWVRDLVAAVLPAPEHPAPPSTGVRPESTSRVDGSSTGGAAGSVAAVGFRTEHQDRTVEGISRR
jgi:transcription-repair coupling factor (superfamily II helicase)